MLKRTKINGTMSSGGRDRLLQLASLILGNDVSSALPSLGVYI